MTEKSSAAISLTTYQKLVLVLLALLQFLVILDFMIISPIGYILTKDLQISTSQFGIIVSSYIFSAAAAGIIAAGFIDRYDRKRLLLFFFTGFIVGTLFCGLSNSFFTLLTARIITGIFGGVVSSITITIVSDLFTPNQRGRAMSAVQMAFAASQILGIPIGLFIANFAGWHFTFLVIAILSLIILIILQLNLKPVTGHLNTSSAKDPFSHLWNTIKNKQHRVGFSATVILGMGMMLQPFISIFLVNNIGLSNEQIPLIFMVTGASAFFIMPLVGKLSDRFDKFRIFLIGSLATIVIIPVYTHLLAAPMWIVLILNVLLFAAIASRMGPYQALNSMIPEPSDRGAYMSVSSSLQQMAGGLGVVIAGAIVFQPHPDSPLQNFDLLGYIVMGLSVLSIYLVRRVRSVTRNDAM
jgi:predicted MFS family arabinose efflux permease